MDFFFHKQLLLRVSLSEALPTNRPPNTKLVYFKEAGKAAGVLCPSAIHRTPGGKKRVTKASWPLPAVERNGPTHCP